MDDKGFLTAMPGKLPEKPVKSQRKNEIISMIGKISDRRSIDMVYGFVRRLYLLDENNFSHDTDALLQCVSGIILAHLKDYVIVSGDVL